MHLRPLCLVPQGKLPSFSPLIFCFLLIHRVIFLLSLVTSEVNNGLKKPELSRNPRYIDTRMDEVYPAKKCRFGKLSGKGNVKVCVLSYVILLFWFVKF